MESAWDRIEIYATVSQNFEGGMPITDKTMDYATFEGLSDDEVGTAVRREALAVLAIIDKPWNRVQVGVFARHRQTGRVARTFPKLTREAFLEWPDDELGRFVRFHAMYKLDRLLTTKPPKPKIDNS